MTLVIDLNADMGEYANEEERAIEQALMPLVTSCSIACGGHAGDRETMRATVRLAKKHGVSIGAHPSYPDREGFGRRSLSIEPDKLCNSLAGQIAVLLAVCKEEEATLGYVKPHGALYNDAARTHALVECISEAINTIGSKLTLLGPPGSALEAEAKKAGLAFAAEGFVDRLYRKDGSLTPRSEKGAIIEDIDARAAQAASIARGEPIKAGDGMLSLSVRTLCIHSDSPGAVETAKAVRAALEETGIAIKAFA
jgi:UPF0271 protein